MIEVNSSQHKNRLNNEIKLRKYCKFIKIAL